MDQKRDHAHGQQVTALENNLVELNFKMEFLSSKKLRHADGLSRLIPKFSEPSEDTVIAALRDEKELSVLLCNTIQELPVT